MAKTKLYDVAIIGAGPAALSASVYASRYHLKNVIIGPEMGGYVSTTHLVDDYLGFGSITGLELAEKMTKHAQDYGAEIVGEKVTEVTKQGKIFSLKTWGEQIFQARALLIAIGTEHN